MTFFISGVVYIFGAFIFIILGEDGIAKWAKGNGDGDDKTEDKIEESENIPNYMKVMMTANLIILLAMTLIITSKSFRTACILMIFHVNH